MRTRMWVLILMTVAAASTGCAPPASGRVYSRQEARMAWDVRNGEVMAVDEAVIEGRRTALGCVGGGLIGYEAGRTVGGGSGRRVAAAVGTVAGAVAARVAKL